ncbi:hypothetical protein, partial [Pseudomonas syringae group genomosp. 7]|uniref:hypothetical protein n=1 Tax=Pseudomonas syringae group genomosp. 7 TaxID=251699 RepID=UPI00376FFBB5
DVEGRRAAGAQVDGVRLVVHAPAADVRLDPIFVAGLTQAGLRNLVALGQVLVNLRRILALYHQAQDIILDTLAPQLDELGRILGP